MRLGSHWRVLVRRGQQQGARPTTPVRADVRPRGASRSGRRSAAGVGVSPRRCAPPPLDGLNRSPVWHLIECSFASLSLFNNGKERTTRPPAGGREAEEQPSGERSDFSLAAPLRSPSVSLLLFSSAARNERRLHSISRLGMDRSGRYESSQPTQRCERITCAFPRHIPNAT